MAHKFAKILVFGTSLIGLVRNVSVTRHLTTPTGCPVGIMVLLTQHSDGTACTKSSDATAAALIASSSRRRAAAVAQGIRRKCRRHGNGGNKHRPSPSPFPLPEVAVAVALPLRWRCLRLRRRGRLGDERPAIVAVVRCRRLSPVSHRHCQGQPRHCRLAAKNLRCRDASVEDYYYYYYY